MQLLFAHQVFGRAAVGAVADEHQFCGHFFAHHRKNFHRVEHAFNRAEIREVHQDGLAIGRPFFGEALIGCAGVQIAVHEVGDHLDGALDVEIFEGLVQQILRNGGDAVALLDGEFGDGQVAAVAADQGDVRAVQRGDEGQAPRGGHGARQHGADGVGDGVVHVQQIERLGLEDLEHFCGERQGVGRVVEQRIGRHLHFVEMDVRVVGVHADGWGVADEVDVVAPGGQFGA